MALDDLVAGADRFAINPIYALSMMAGFALIFLFPLTKDFTSAREKTQYYYLQLITLVGAIIGAKFAVIMGDALWPIQPFADWSALLYSGRSIVGALLFGFVSAEIAKPLMGYGRPPNDRFAILIPFSIAIGRIGCWFTGCCLGLPIEGRHILHPIAFYEIVFHVTTGVVLVLLYKERRFSGQLFAVFMIAYGTFRYASETLRATDKVFYGLSAYQWFAIALIVAGMASYSARRQHKRVEVSHGE